MRKNSPPETLEEEKNKHVQREVERGGGKSKNFPGRPCWREKGVRVEGKTSPLRGERSRLLYLEGLNRSARKKKNRKEAFAMSGRSPSTLPFGLALAKTSLLTTSRKKTRPPRREIFPPSRE